jgi:hypothetical protein
MDENMLDFLFVRCLASEFSFHALSWVLHAHAFRVFCVSHFKQPTLKMNVFCVSCLRRSTSKLESIFCVGRLKQPTQKILIFFAGYLRRPTSKMKSYFW